MSVQHKILRTANAPSNPPDETEISVAQALLDLESHVPELKAELRPLQISAAREVDVRGGKKAIVVFVPVPQLKAFRKVQARYVFHRLSVNLPQAAFLIIVVCIVVGLPVNSRRSSTTAMLFSSLNAACCASRHAHHGSSRNVPAAEPLRASMRRSWKISFSRRRS